MDYKESAAQFRKPEGEQGLRIAQVMSSGNANFYQLLSEVISADVSSMIEIGMGGGSHVNDLVERFNLDHYTGWDYSKDMVVLSAENYQSECATFELVDVNDVLPEHQKVDLILMINTVYFFDNPEEVFKKLLGLLKPGGQLIVGKRPKEDMQAMNEVTQYNFTLYTDEEVAEMLYHSGYSDIKASCYPDPPIQFLGKELSLHSEFVMGSN